MNEIILLFAFFRCRPDASPKEPLRMIRDVIHPTLDFSWHLSSHDGRLHAVDFARCAHECCSAGIRRQKWVFLPLSDSNPPITISSWPKAKDFLMLRNRSIGLAFDWHRACAASGVACWLWNRKVKRSCQQRLQCFNQAAIRYQTTTSAGWLLMFHACFHCISMLRWALAGNTW